MESRVVLDLVVRFWRVRCESGDPAEGEGAEWKEDEHRGPSKALILHVFRRFNPLLLRMGDALIVLDDTPTFPDPNYSDCTHRILWYIPGDVIEGMQSEAFADT